MSLGSSATVYQAKLLAIERCVQLCLEEKLRNQRIHIYSDSQAVLKSFCKQKVTSKFLWHCIELLIELSKNNIVQLVWVPGHSGIDGNEKADELARKGSSL